MSAPIQCCNARRPCAATTTTREPFPRLIQPSSIIRASNAAPDGAGEMMAALAPIQTGMAKLAPLQGQRGRVDPQLPQQAVAGGGENQAVARRRERAPGQQALVDRHAQFAGEVVVAHARLAQRRFARTQPVPQRTGPESDAHQGLEQLGDIAVGQPEIAVPSLALDGEESRIQQFGEVGADRLLGHAGDGGELGRRQRPIGHQRGKHFGARMIADQSRDADDVRAVFHGSMLNEPSQRCKR